MSATGVHDDTMQYDEWVALMKKAELLDDSLSRVVLTDCFVKAQLDDSAVAVEWKNAADSCKTLIFPEFEEGDSGDLVEGKVSVPGTRRA